MLALNKMPLGFTYLWLTNMQFTADLIEKRYSDIPYPEGKDDRVTLLRDITNSEVNGLKDKIICAQVVMDILSDQGVLFENLVGSDKKEVLDWVAKNWCESDIEYVDLLVTIATNLEPKVAKEFLSHMLNKTSNSDVRDILEDGLSEIEE